MIAYKGTTNFKCRDITIEIGETYTHEGDLIICRSGFHFCKNMEDIDYYYDLDDNNTKILEIEVLGEVRTEENKSITNKFKVLREVPRKEWKNCKFNEQCDLIYWEDSKGNWKKNTYNNNTINVEYADGSWKTKKYDKNNNEISYEDSEGIWQKNTYDENNNNIRYEDSTGYWEEYTYKDNKLTGITTCKPCPEHLHKINLSGK